MILVPYILDGSFRWRHMQAYTQPGVILAPLIMGQDGTTIDGNSRRSLIPVYLTSANIRATIRNLPHARVLVGYLPKYSKNDKPRHMSDENWKEVKRVMYKTAMAAIFQPLREVERTGVRMQLRCRTGDMHVRTVVPFLMFYSCDNPEIAKITGHRDGYVGMPINDLF